MKYKRVLFEDVGTFKHEDLYLYPVMDEHLLVGESSDTMAKNDFYCIEYFIDRTYLTLGKIDKYGYGFYVNGIYQLDVLFDSEEKIIDYFFVTNFSSEIKEIRGIR